MGDGGVGSRLTLDIWHPECWMLEVTEAMSPGLLGHWIHEVNGQARGRFTAYAESTDCLEEFVEAVRESRLTRSVWIIDRPYATGTMTEGRAACEIVVAYERAHSISEPLVSRGFIPDAPIRIHDGRERWTVVAEADRETIQRRLDAFREVVDAELRVDHVGLPDSALGQRTVPRDDLSERQREVFELARNRGYYTWPRRVSAGDLAAELDIATTTLLEHLRKAEAKLLDPTP